MIQDEMPLSRYDGRDQVLAAWASSKPLSWANTRRELRTMAKRESKTSQKLVCPSKDIWYWTYLRVGPFYVWSSLTNQRPSWKLTFIRWKRTASSTAGVGFKRGVSTSEVLITGLGSGSGASPTWISFRSYICNLLFCDTVSFHPKHGLILEKSKLTVCQLSSRPVHRHHSIPTLVRILWPQKDVYFQQWPELCLLSRYRIIKISYRRCYHANIGWVALGSS